MPDAPRWQLFAQWIWDWLPGPVQRRLGEMGRDAAVSAGARAAPSVGRTLALALLCGALSQAVIHSPQFSHDRRYLDFIGASALEGWLLALGWLVLLAARWWVAGRDTAALIGKRLPFGLAVLAVVGGLAAPFLTPYWAHFTHPLLAVALAWTAWPLPGAMWARLAPAFSGWSATPRAAEGWGAAALAVGLIFLQSYRRHLWFGSGGKDLGLFHQTAWLLSQFESPQNTVLGMHAFADHTELIDFLAVPAQWLWPSAGAMLLVQALIVGLGAVPVFDLAQRKLGGRVAGWCLAAVYLLSFDMQNAVMFDWNPTTCAAGIIPWVVWTFERERPLGFVLALTLLAACKENMILYALALSLTLAIGSARRLPLYAAAAMGVLFVLAMWVVLPMFGPGFRHLVYPALGESAPQMAGSVVASPLRAFGLLWTPGAKIDGLLLPFSSVAFACLLAPRYLVAFAPALLERFWSAHNNRWWDHHYGAGIAALVVLAAIEGLGRLDRFISARGQGELGRVAVAAVLLSCVFVGTLSRLGPAPMWVWRHPYYTTAEDRRDAEAALAAIPPRASVAAQNHLLPHLSARREIYEITRPVRADYVALDMAQDCWPYGRDYARKLGRELLDQGYGVAACEGEAVVLKRGAPARGCRSLRGGSAEAPQ